MKKPTAEMIRRLQKDGSYHFESGLTRAEPKKAATALAKAAQADDRKNGVLDSSFGICRDAFGYYFAAAIC